MARAGVRPRAGVLGAAASGGAGSKRGGGAGRAPPRAPAGGRQLARVGCQLARVAGGARALLPVRPCRRGDGRLRARTGRIKR
eukprot:1194363-Prorocentrum_minimum.AAC.2